MPIAPAEHDGITGVTFPSGRHRLLGTLYLARGSWGSGGRYDLRTIPADVTAIDGAGHDFAWERSYFRELVTGWLDEIEI